MKIYSKNVMSKKIQCWIRMNVQKWVYIPEFLKLMVSYAAGNGSKSLLN